MNTRRKRIVSIMAVLIAAACGGSNDAVNTEAQARRAYLGLDLSVDRAINLGLDGFNDATNANIPEKSGPGDASGTMTVSGQVDQGVSANKEMNLRVALVDYSDGPVEQDTTISYSTDVATPMDFFMSLRNIPTGTFTGTMLGEVVMSGDLQGTVALDLALAGEIEPDPNTATGIRRVMGTTTITGTATSSYGVYQISLTR